MTRDPIGQLGNRKRGAVAWRISCLLTHQFPTFLAIVDIVWGANEEGKREKNFRYTINLGNKGSNYRNRIDLAAHKWTKFGKELYIITFFVH